MRAPGLTRRFSRVERPKFSMHQLYYPVHKTRYLSLPRQPPWPPHRPPCQVDGPSAAGHGGSPLKTKEISGALFL